MATVPKAVESRLKKYVSSVQNRIIDAKEHILTKTEILGIFKYIACNIFGFDEQSELIDLSIAETSYCYLGVQTQDEIKYIMDLGSPKISLNNENLGPTIEYAIRHHIELVVRTNGITWEIHRSKCEQPNEYDIASSFNFLELNSNNEDDLTNLFLLCKEAHTKTIITDQYNRYRWWGFLSEDKRTIEYMFLLSVCLHEDGSEKVLIPHLDITYRCDKPFIARRNAEKAIEKHLKDEYGKEYDSQQKFESVAYYREATYIKTNCPIWW